MVRIEQGGIMQHCIAYFSPAGSTRRVAERVQHVLQNQKIQPQVFDLSRQGQEATHKTLATLTCSADEPCLLWVGSPVYCDHALPPLMEQLASLPAHLQGYSVPFVTWGGVCSGLALPEMAALLVQKNLPPLAAAKVLAEHSSTWDAPEPWAAGRPHEEDLVLVDRLVAEVLQQVQTGTVHPLDLHRLEYLSSTQRADAALKSLPKAKTAVGTPRADEGLCTQCGECEQACPTGAMGLQPWPLVQPELCILCQQCVRHCPEQAFPHDGAQAVQRCANMAAASDEGKVTAVFY